MFFDADWSLPDLNSDPVSETHEERQRI